jgi:hypothetical protein
MEGETSWGANDEARPGGDDSRLAGGGDESGHDPVKRAKKEKAKHEKGFTLFSTEVHEEAKDEHPAMSTTELAQMKRKMWNELEQTERNKHAADWSRQHGERIVAGKKRAAEKRRAADATGVAPIDADVDLAAATDLPKAEETGMMDDEDAAEAKRADYADADSDVAAPG